MVSVVIPSYKDPYLQKTINSLIENSEGEIEIIAVLDGYWPETQLEDQKCLKIVHLGKNRGMRGAINAGMALATGEFVMKCDAHCAFDTSWDTKLKADCEENWAVVPVRYDLDVEKWVKKGEKKEFQYIEKGTLKGRNWKDYTVEGDIVDLMTTQGSCYFMPRSLWELIGGLDDINYGGMGREAQEVSLKVWTSGGRFVLNRKTWYAHWSKPKEFSLGKPGKEKSIEYAQSYWTEEKLRPLIEKFNPPSW